MGIIMLTWIPKIIVQGHFVDIGEVDDQAVQQLSSRRIADLFSCRM
jgi:hypothetical protein